MMCSCLCVPFGLVFFFKQKTAYEMRISDWSSDVCSSDLDVVDRWGNMVAATPSGGWFQSSPVVPGLGFSLSTRAQMFWLEEGLPSTLRPGRRPRTTLTPSMALQDGQPYLAWGTPGGDKQIRSDSSRGKVVTYV